MKCVICRQGDTQLGTTTVTLQRGVTTVVIKEVPATICNNCGEYYLDAATSERALTLAEQSVRHGAEIEVLRFAA
ncbi:MAG: type II toxin-antitoxin system MqsA family antitoxin [Gammaproteobacteria bacterium]|nr:type II toxin-antitoxin system MqsA family antitoxin [Gammaproteobacteria bacterium]